jgi:hypothetical protein
LSAAHRGAAGRARQDQSIRQTTSINDIRTAIRELSLRADLAHQDGRPDDATEIEQRIQNYRGQRSERP